MAAATRAEAPLSGCEAHGVPLHIASTGAVGEGMARQIESLVENLDLPRLTLTEAAVAALEVGWTG